MYTHRVLHVHMVYYIYTYKYAVHTLKLAVSKYFPIGDYVCESEWVVLQVC